MRVAIVCPSYPPRDRTCGVGDYTRCLAEELARQGEAVTVFTAPDYRGDVDGPVNVRQVPGVASGEPGRADADLVNLQYAPDLYRDGLGAMLRALCVGGGRRRPPMVVTLHTLTAATLGSRIAALGLLHLTRRTISTNEEVTAMIHRRTPWLAPRVREIPIGSNVREIAPSGDRAGVRARFGVPATAPLVAHFGLVYPGKGLETLLGALGMLRAARSDAHLVVIGDTRPEDRSYRAALVERLEGLGLSGAVTWTGPQPSDDVSRLLAAADVYAVPYDDGASVRRGTLLAGLCHGLPVVTTTPRVPSRYLRDGENVTVVPPRDPGALAARLAVVLEDEAVRTRLADGARALAAQFSWAVIAERTREVFHEVVGR